VNISKGGSRASAATVLSVGQRPRNQAIKPTSTIRPIRTKDCCPRQAGVGVRRTPPAGTKGMINENILEERLSKLQSAQSWKSLIRSAPDEALFRINPIPLAVERGVAENEAINLFLHATLAGLVEMD